MQLRGTPTACTVHGLTSNGKEVMEGERNLVEQERIGGGGGGGGLRNTVDYWAEERRDVTLIK
jgi:hypothetical protein